jgi:hypothetical protein
LIFLTVVVGPQELVVYSTCGVVVDIGDVVGRAGRVDGGRRAGHCLSG